MADLYDARRLFAKKIKYRNNARVIGVRTESLAAASGSRCSAACACFGYILVCVDVDRFCRSDRGGRARRSKSRILPRIAFAPPSARDSHAIIGQSARIARRHRYLRHVWAVVRSVYATRGDITTKCIARDTWTHTIGNE